jgi:REP element-mobilizing transposase RayT
MKGEPIRLVPDQANALLAQLLETAQHRHWRVLAAAVLGDHVHVVLGVEGGPEPEKLLGDLKAYGSQRLNRGWGQRPNGSWWSDKGSKRKLPHEGAVRGAVVYVADQAGALAMYVAPECEELVRQARADPTTGPT